MCIRDSINMSRFQDTLDLDSTQSSPPKIDSPQLRTPGSSPMGSVSNSDLWQDALGFGPCPQIDGIPEHFDDQTMTEEKYEDNPGEDASITVVPDGDRLHGNSFQKGSTFNRFCLLYTSPSPRDQA
eukprot:TRINITY_DN14412_c0_g1_i1.p1 TRINITY_DN14412_c0_g1~~TRINITY_DN14412_c0_g1_i1.p1  ORF type:complete len:144 (+),score=29.20 TRINITY_DN14412_c0_g1_i1:55-432(+)